MGEWSDAWSAAGQKNIWGTIPNVTEMQSEGGKKITLGLDLQGGLHMLLGIKSDIAIESRIKSMAATIKYIFDDEEIIFDELGIVDQKEITFELLDQDDVVKTKELLKKELKGTILNENGQEVEESIEGEICIRGYNVASGYLGDTKINHAFRNGWFHSGDYGTKDKDENFNRTKPTKK